MIQNKFNYIEPSDKMLKLSWNMDRVLKAKAPLGAKPYKKKPFPKRRRNSRSPILIDIPVGKSIWLPCDGLKYHPDYLGIHHSMRYYNNRHICFYASVAHYDGNKLLGHEFARLV